MGGKLQSTGMEEKPKESFSIELIQRAFRLQSVTAAPGLLDYLKHLQAKGQTHVHLDAEAKSVLRTLYKKARATSQPAPITPQSAPATLPPNPDFANPAACLEPKPKKPAPLPVAKLTPTTGPAQDRISTLKEQASNWPALKALGTLRTNLVFSCGNPEADILLVGEAPGLHDERKQSPFAGPAGQKLDGILKAMGLDREQVYITNVVKYRPAMADQSTGNRKPSEEEIAASMPFLNEEISILQPKVIIALGATAAKALTGSEGTVTSRRGAWHAHNGIPVRVTFHPSYLLHNDRGVSDKRQVWEDMLAVMEKLQMQISEKQRGYFRPKA